MVKVKIKGTIITTQYGTLKDGDILTTNDSFAKHLVMDCNAADYLEIKELPKEDLSKAKKNK